MDVKSGHKINVLHWKGAHSVNEDTQFRYVKLVCGLCANHLDLNRQLRITSHILRMIFLLSIERLIFHDLNTKNVRVWMNTNSKHRGRTQDLL